LLLVSGCGPIQSYTSILRAQEAVKAAKSKQGWKYACYEFYAARRYLLRARIEAGYSDFEASTDYANKATKYAKRARALAQLHRSRGSQPLQNGKIKYVLEGKGQVRVVCGLPPIMKKTYAKKLKHAVSIKLPTVPTGRAAKRAAKKVAPLARKTVPVVKKKQAAPTPKKQ
jgi:hypothetical protein